MEKVKITFEIEKDFVRSLATLMGLLPKDPDMQKRLFEEMADTTIDADDEDLMVGQSTEIKTALSLILIGTTAKRLGV